MIYIILKYLIIPVAGILIYLISKIKNNKTSGILTTVIVHAVLVTLLLVLPGFKNDTIFQQGGLEVALGYPIEGGNTGTLAADGSDMSNPPPPEQATGDNSLDKDIATDDQSESNVALPEKNKKTHAPKTTQTTTTTKTEPKVPERQVDKTSTYKKNKGTQNGNAGGDPNSNGQGGNDKGNKGDPNGSIGGNPDGTGKGTTGVGPGLVTLAGRVPKSWPSISNDFEEQGKLVLEIVVGPDGKVKRVRKATGSTLTNYAQIERMKKLVLTTLTFAVKPDADDEQIGYYTINFVKK